MNEPLTADASGAHPPPTPGAQRGAPGAVIDVAQLTERVYRLLLDEVRLEQTRRGTRALPRPRG